VGNGQINFNDILRIGKKLFTFYKKWSKKQQQKQHAQQQQQQNQGYHSQAQPNYSQNQNQSPYPPPAVGHAGGQQQQNAWNNHQGYQQQPQQQTHYGGGGYGAHDGKPTVSFSLNTFPTSSPLSPFSLALSSHKEFEQLPTRLFYFFPFFFRSSPNFPSLLHSSFPPRKLINMV